MTYLKYLASTVLLITAGPGWAAESESKSASKRSTGSRWVTEKPLPTWIWRADKTDNEPIFLRKTFELPEGIDAAKLYFTCDNGADVYINGKKIGTAPDWSQPVRKNQIEDSLRSGKNSIAVKAHNRGGVAAFVLKLVVDAGEETIDVLSDPTWKLSTQEVDRWQATEFDDSGWNAKLKGLGTFGVQPWGIPGSGGRGGDPLDTDQIYVPDGFEIELIYEVPKDEHGSWVSLTVDPQGRLYASDQGDKGLYRISVVDQSGQEPEVAVEKVPVALSGAQGLVWAFDSLYFNRSGGHLYRLTDSDGDGRLDQAEQLPSATGGGEHGNHAVIETEDKQALYVVGGNHTALPPSESISGSRVPSWNEDLLLPRQWDANGHARGVLAPGGWVTRFDPTTKQHEVISTGYRNEYDITLNKYGDLFTYDADMEWDMGSPWYRPTRICHVISGSDFGWRSGSGKWPSYYEDSLPPTVDIGPGSPTGVVAGIGTKFPARYQDAIFALDWTFGTIYAIHTRSDGAGYRGSSEPFCHGTPLPVTDAIVGSDGALYFTIGGRGAQSALFRITYVGDESTAPVPPAEPSEAVKHRRRLEAFHGRQNADAVAAAWPSLSSSDRWLRHAARIAIESQPLDQWASRVYHEPDTQARITGAVALARSAGTAASRTNQPERALRENYRKPLLASLIQLDPAELPESQLLGLLRAYALTFIRLGKPTIEERDQIVAQLEPLLPSANADVNTESIRVLVYLQSQHVIEKTIQLIADRSAPEVPDWVELAGRNAGYGGGILRMLNDHPPTREIGYAFMLRNLKDGWTLSQRRVFFEFLNAAAKHPGGNSYGKFLTNLRDEALGYCTNEQRAALADITGENFNPEPDFPITPPKGPGQKWSIDSALAHANRGKLRGADFENGRNLFHAAKCASCHRLGGIGGDIGPDLSSVRNKFDERYVLESIIQPSNVISDQYASSQVMTSDGNVFTGLVVRHGDSINVYPPAVDLKGTVRTIPLDDVEQMRPSPVSQMPTGLIDLLNADEVRDLVAYLMSAGNPQDRVYGR